jgi:hypothetical protein
MIYIWQRLALAGGTRKETRKLEMNNPRMKHNFEKRLGGEGVCGILPSSNKSNGKDAVN